MLPPNVIGSIDNLTRNGILDYGTAAYVADVRPNRYGYLMNSNMLNPNPYSTPFDSFSYANNPFGNYYVRRRFWQKIGNIALLLGVTYLGGKVFLRSAQGVKALGKNKNVVNAAELLLQHPLLKLRGLEQQQQVLLLRQLQQRQVQEPLQALKQDYQNCLVK